MLPEILEAHADDEPVDLSVPVADQMTARHLLIELARNQSKQSQLKATLASVQGEYRSRINTLSEREEAIRQSLLNYAQTHGPESFPDVGGFSVRRTKAKVKVVDEGMLVEWLAASGHDDLIVETTTFTPAPEAMVLVEDAVFNIGEMPDGVAVTPEGESLTVRGLS